MARSRRRRVDRHLKEQRERKYRLRAHTSKFIPAPDSEFACMARNFANYLAANAARLPLSPQQLENLAAAVEEFRMALSKTKWPDTRGPKATSLKNQARGKAEKIIRAAARILRADESLNSVDRAMLNVGERPQRLKARSCPQIAPVLRFIGATHGHDACGGTPRHILEYGNDFDRASNAKPHGAARLELFVGLVLVGEAVPTHPDQWGGWLVKYLRSYSTSRFEVQFPYAGDGRPVLVVYWGRWADARGSFGPYSQTCVARVEGGQMPEPLYIGNHRPALASVSRKVEPKLFAMLEARYQLPANLEGDEPAREIANLGQRMLEAA